MSPSTTTTTTTAIPASPASFPGSNSLQNIPNRPPTTNHTASWNRPPHQPLPWKWICHKCRTSWRLATTRRCLRCDHKFCYSYQQAATSSSTTSSRKRKRGGSCKMSFDYVGWAARGAWRRTLLLNAEDNNNNNNDDDDDEECDPRLSSVTSSRSSHKMILQSSKRRVGQMASTISSIANDGRPGPREQHAADQNNNLRHDMSVENGILSPHGRWLTPHSLSCAWGDEHSAMRRRNEDQLVKEFNPQREALFVRRLHNCWLHCDFPSECRFFAMQASAEGRPVGQEAMEVDERYLREKRTKIQRLEKGSSGVRGGVQMRTPSSSSRLNGRRKQAISVQEWSSGGDDEFQDENGGEDDWVSSSSSDDDDYQNSLAGIMNWQDSESTGEKATFTENGIDRAIEQMATIVATDEYDSDDERSPTSPLQPPSGYTASRLSIVDETSISNSPPASSYQSFGVPPPPAPTTCSAARMETNFDLPSPPDVDTRSTSKKPLPTISEEIEHGQTAGNQSEDEGRIFFSSLLADARRTTRETRRVHADDQSAAPEKSQILRSSRQTSQTAFESFPTFQENDKDDQDEVEDEAEFDRQLRQAYSENSWYPDTDKDANETSESGGAAKKKRKTRQHRRPAVRRERSTNIFKVLRRQIKGVAGAGATASTRSPLPSTGLDADEDVESLTDDSNTPGSSRTPSPPIELDTAVIGSDGFEGLVEIEDEEDLETLGYIQPSSVAVGRPWGPRVLEGMLSTKAGPKNSRMLETTAMIVDDDC